MEAICFGFLMLLQSLTLLLIQFVVECFGYYSWRWSWDAPVSSNQKESKASRSTWSELSFDWYLCEQLYKQYNIQDLCSHAIQLCISKSPSFAGLYKQHGWLQKWRFCGSTRCSTKSREPQLVPGTLLPS